jgi:tRNA-dihydrouridine synthase B
MAGVTDQPFRKLCRNYGAALTPSEMVTANIRLWDRDKCRLRRCHDSEEQPRVVQIAGADPAMMVAAAQRNVDEGAQIIDINMGCPAKKVLKRAAGSALLQTPLLVRDILTAVVGAVPVPVTLKIRTGWDPQHRNGVAIARLAEDCGVQSLAVHGRTRACAFRGDAEYDTIAAIKQAVAIPVFANGDIGTPRQARDILDYTGADGIMIGRAAQGSPWLFANINYFLAHGTEAPPLPLTEIHRLIRNHLRDIHAFYGTVKGVFFARKHTAWYLGKLAQRLETAFPEAEYANRAAAWRRCFYQLQDCAAQLDALDDFFQHLTEQQQKQPIKDLAA